MGASQRLLKQKNAEKVVHIIHLGDHDPSGMDMSRDIFERLTLFVGEKVHVQRIALNYSQVQRYNLPPDFAKASDSRFKEYQKKFGEDSWELDAIPPEELVALINRAVLQFRNQEKWDELVSLEKRGRLTLTTISDRFADVVRFLKGGDATPPTNSGGGPGSGGPNIPTMHRSADGWNIVHEAEGRSTTPPPPLKRP